MQRTGGGQSAGLGLAFKRDVGNTNVLGTLFLKDSRVCGAPESPELGVDERILIVDGIRDLWMDVIGSDTNYFGAYREMVAYPLPSSSLLLVPKPRDVLVATGLASDEGSFSD